MTELKLPAAQLLTLLARMERSGVDTEALLEERGIAREDLAESMRPLPLAHFTTLAGHAEDLTGDPLFAMRAAYYTEGDEFVWARFALGALPTVGDLLETFADFAGKVVCPVRIEMRPHADGAELTLTALSGRADELARYVEFSVGLAFSSIRAGLTRPVNPRKVLLKHAPRAPKSAYEEMLGAGVQFGAGRDAVHFPQRVLDLPLSRPNPTLARLSLEALLKEAARFAPESRDFSTIVLGVLQQADSHQAWTVNAVADLLEISPRTMQHRLRQGGASFQQMADMVRREKAGLLLDKGTSQAEIAYLLGYADEGSLRKAFQRWYGIPPGKRTQAS